MNRHSMNLPDGKKCGDCIHFQRCEWLIACSPNNTTCDWIPSKFYQIINKESESK